MEEEKKKQKPMGRGERLSLQAFKNVQERKAKKMNQDQKKKPD